MSLYAYQLLQILEIFFTKDQTHEENIQTDQNTEKKLNSRAD